MESIEIQYPSLALMRRSAWTEYGGRVCLARPQHQNKSDSRILSQSARDVRRGAATSCVVFVHTFETVPKNVSTLLATVIAPGLTQVTRAGQSRRGSLRSRTLGTTAGEQGQQRYRRNSRQVTARSQRDFCVLCNVGRGLTHARTHLPSSVRPCGSERRAESDAPSPRCRARSGGTSKGAQRGVCLYERHRGRCRHPSATWRCGGM